MKRETQAIGVAVLATLSSGQVLATAIPLDVSAACSPPALSQNLWDMWTQTFINSRDTNAESEESYLQRVRDLIANRCQESKMSAQDINEIVEAALLVNESDPARYTNSVQINMANVTQYVNFGLDHALIGICGSDLGALSAVRHCVCTSITINNLPLGKSLIAPPKCK